MPEPYRLAERVNPEVRSEKRDADALGVVLFAVVLIVGAIIAHVLVWGLLRKTDRAEEQL